MKPLLISKIPWNKYIIYTCILLVSCNSKNSKGVIESTRNLVKGFSDEVHFGQLQSVALQRLNLIGKLWGFLKYYHPTIAEGNVDWDTELFKFLPKIISAKSDLDFNKIVNDWVDGLGQIKPCRSCAPNNSDGNVKLAPDFNWVLEGHQLDTALKVKLQYIFTNRRKGENHYIGVANNGNPEIKNENAYENLSYPNAAIRLLALYRYWNIIQYYYPYKYLIGEDWNKVLPEFIPKFITAKDSTSYTFVCLELIARIHDSHANVLGDNNSINDYYGRYFAPVRTSIVENSLVVTGYYFDTLKIAETLKVGDVIKKINNQLVSDLISRNLIYLPASNYERQLFDAPLAVLMRGHKEEMSLEIMRDNIDWICNIKCVERNLLFNRLFKNSGPDTSYKLIAGNIGYIDCKKYHVTELEDIRQSFKKVNGIVVNLRGYPSDNMAYTITPYIKSMSTPFAKITLFEPGTPGLFLFGKDLLVGENSGDNFNGPVVALVNAQTGSAAEFIAMALQSSANVKVIGSTTAGADGDVSRFYLPGGIETQISGIGIYYPNGSETQRKGVRIDYVIKPSIKGIAEGKDNLLEKAIQIINNSK